MSASNIPTIQSHINLPSRVERVIRIDNQINSNNRKINALENQINAQKEVSAAADIKVDKELFFTLPKRIEAALDKKYESLSVKEFRKLVDANYKSVENFFRIKRLDYLDLALKDIKV